MKKNLTLRYCLHQCAYWAASAGILSFATAFFLEKGFPASNVGLLLACGSVLPGATQPALAERADRARSCILVPMLDTLEYLKRGGRISKAVALAGGLLSIKPVVTLADGEIAILGKARGSKQGNNLLVSEIQKAGGVDFSKPALLGYTGISDALLQKYIEDSKALWEENSGELRTTAIGSVIGTHAGPGAIAAAFFKK